MSTLQEIYPAHPVDVLDFLESVSCGVGQLNAALAVKWTPKKLRQMLADPSFVELVEEARTRGIESVEQKVHELAMRGNMAAITLFLYSQAADRGWRPPAQRVAVSQQSTVKLEVVEGTKAAVLAQLAAGDIKALQPGGALDVIEAEVVED